MQVELKIDAEAVQRQVVDSLLSSAIGDAIKAAITKLVSEKDWNRGTLVEQACREVLFDELRKMIRVQVLALEPQLQEIIREKVNAEAARRVAIELVDKLWEK